MSDRAMASGRDCDRRADSDSDRARDSDSDQACAVTPLRQVARPLFHDHASA